MSEASETANGEETTASNVSPWKELWTKEDWWAVWLGLGTVLIAVALFSKGISISWIAVSPGKWTDFSQLVHDLGVNAPRYAAQFALLLGLFTIATSFIGLRPAQFVPSFTVLYLASLIIIALGNWAQAQRYNLEPPLIALAAGLLVSNLAVFPNALAKGFRTEFYIKLGIVLLGATLPFTLIVWAGPIAILQASIVSLATFYTIFLVAKKLGLDRRFAATLGAGGAVCGVSAAIAVAAAVRAKKEHPPIAISLVVFWAIVMIFVLPPVAHLLHLPAGVGGAWIGTSEFADAAGLAAAQTFGGLASASSDIAGKPDDAIAAYTLVKVIGRDVWIGIWAFTLAYISVTRWEKTEVGSKAQAAQIWSRFPKFVIGFLIASAVVTLVVHSNTLVDYNKIVKPALIAPITVLRTWAFTFSFLSIGLTTRFSQLSSAGAKPFLAFTLGVVVNLILGYFLSAIVFSKYWTQVTTH